MRIGIMLRHMDQHAGGVKVYTRNLLPQILELEVPHELVLMYRDPAHLGTFGDRDRVREVAVSAPGAALWDQLAVPRVERREKLDVILNLKSTVPILAKGPTVFVCHGLSKSFVPGAEKWSSMLHHRWILPLYLRKARAVIAISEVVKEGLVDRFGVDARRIHTVHHGAGEAFRRPARPERLEATKKALDLPERFFLYCGQIYPPKNFGRLLQAYARVGPQSGISLVVAGEHRWRSEAEVALADRLGLTGWVRWLGWVGHETLPDVYHLAQALVLPSLYESFGIPILEAHAAGCPVVTSNRFGTAETAGDAAILVDPEDVESIADGMRRIVSDPDLRRLLVERGHARAGLFTWERCARETLRVVEASVAPPS